jgi:hypothetical protein
MTKVLTAGITQNYLQMFLLKGQLDPRLRGDDAKKKTASPSPASGGKEKKTKVFNLDAGWSLPR